MNSTSMCSFSQSDCVSNHLTNSNSIFKNCEIVLQLESTVIEFVSYLVTQIHLSQNILYTKRELLPGQL